MKLITAILLALSALAQTTVTDTVYTPVNELATLRTEISAGRAEDREENRNWINGSFMRASTVEAKLDHFEGWLGAHEKRLDKLEKSKD